MSRAQAALSMVSTARIVSTLPLGGHPSMFASRMYVASAAAIRIRRSGVGGLGERSSGSRRWYSDVFHGSFFRAMADSPFVVEPATPLKTPRAPRSELQNRQREVPSRIDDDRRTHAGREVRTR